MQHLGNCIAEMILCSRFLQIEVIVMLEEMET